MVPVSREIALGKPCDTAFTVTVIWDAVFPGAQVPANCAPAGLVSDIASGGSPFEKVTTTCEFGTGVPQSSVTRTLNGVGHPAGDANAFTSDELVTASLAGEHPAAERCLSPAEAGSVAPAGKTSSVTLAVRMVWLENETDTSPVYTPGFKLVCFTLTVIWPGLQWPRIGGHCQPGRSVRCRLAGAGIERGPPFAARLDLSFPVHRSRAGVEDGNLAGIGQPIPLASVKAHAGRAQGDDRPVR